jgi:hypothetical protein
MAFYNQQVVCSIPLGMGTPGAAGTFLVPVMALPGTSEYGGGITITKVWYCANKAVAAGSAPTAELISMTSTGGTVAIVCTALSSAAWTAGTPVAGTLVAGKEFVPGTVSYIGVKVGHDLLTSQDTCLNVGIMYVSGRGDK